MILQRHNFNLLFLALNLNFFCVYKFLKFSVVFNIKSIITYNYRQFTKLPPKSFEITHLPLILFLFTELPPLGFVFTEIPPIGFVFTKLLVS